MNEMVIEQRRRDRGGGFVIGRVLPFAERRMVGPFVFFDHMWPLDLGRGVDRSVAVRSHPHIGLLTVTYLFAGEVRHRDSPGYGQAVRPQEVSWMVAESGITHSERFERARAEGDHQGKLGQRRNRRQELAEAPIPSRASDAEEAAHRSSLRIKDLNQGISMIDVVSTSFRPALLAICMLAIAGVGVTDSPAHAQSREQERQDARACASFGLSYGTRGYSACMLELQRRGKARQLSTLEEMAITSQIARDGQIMAERARRQRCDRSPERRECRRR